MPPAQPGLAPVNFPLPPLPTGFGFPAANTNPLTLVDTAPDGVSQFSTTPAPAIKTTGRRGVSPPVEPPPNSLALEREFQKWPGQIVHLPDGLTVPDPQSPTGLLMSPFSDLSDVAAAGARVRFLRDVFDHGLFDAYDRAKDYMRHYVGIGGIFDYQRRAYPFGKDGFTQLRQFRNVSNFNVGLLWQQTGYPLLFGLLVAGQYAAKHSSNYRPDQPFGLDTPTREWIERGYRAGESGVFDTSHRR